MKLAAESQMKVQLAASHVLLQPILCVGMVMTKECLIDAGAKYKSVNEGNHRNRQSTDTQVVRRRNTEKLDRRLSSLQKVPITVSTRQRVGTARNNYSLENISLSEIITKTIISKI